MRAPLAFGRPPRKRQVLKEWRGKGFRSETLYHFALARELFDVTSTAHPARHDRTNGGAIT